VLLKIMSFACFIFVYAKSVVRVLVCLCSVFCGYLFCDVDMCLFVSLRLCFYLLCIMFYFYCSLLSVREEEQLDDGEWTGLAAFARPQVATANFCLFFYWGRGMGLISQGVSPGRSRHPVEDLNHSPPH
jgi:hypothetical protein